MTNICKNCGKSFEITADDLGFYKKMDVPAPTRCPDCRYQQRLVDRNEWNLHRRKCDFTGEMVVSIYSPDAPFPVYKQDIWKSDKWDPLSYGRDFDFSRPFFEQYEDLRRVVPHLALVNFDSVNSEYTNQAQYNKDCYMISASGTNEKCMYGNWYHSGCYFSADCSILSKSEFCYECVNCWRCSSCAWCQDCFDCISVYFSIDCHGSTNCFGSINLRNKQYVWFNEQLTKEEYEKRFKEFDWSRESVVAMIAKARAAFLKFPRKFYHGIKAFSSTGDYIKNIENSRQNFNCNENKDTAYLQDAGTVKDSLDITEVLAVEQSYQIQGCADINRSMVIRSAWIMTDCYYCDMSFSSTDCFGCFGIRQKQYCILNKQYGKEEYLALKEKIIAHMKKTGEWGEYFPTKYSPFGYNESIAQVYFPLTNEQALAAGYSWTSRGDERKYEPTMLPKDIPSRISETTDAILKEVIGCNSQQNEEQKRSHDECSTAFKITPLELALYRKLNIPIPDKCCPCRRQDRLALRNPRKLWNRNCAKCNAPIETSYAPDRPEIVYCEACYNAEVV